MFNSSSTQDRTPNQLEESLDNQPSSEFQILNAPSPSAEHGTYSHLQNLHISVSTAAFDLSPDEIQTQLRDLLKENLELKETLQQNNHAMGEQFERLLAWRKEMATIQQQHKVKFEETRLLVHQLRAENAEMKKQLQNLDSAKKDYENLELENIVLKKQVTEIEQAKEKLRKENERLSVIELQMKKELSTAVSNYELMKSKHNHLLIEKQELMALNNELNAKLGACQSVSPVKLPSTVLHHDVHQNHDFVVVPLQQSETETRKDKKSIAELLLQLRMEQDKVAMITSQLDEEQKKNFSLKAEIVELRKCLGPPDHSVEQRGAHFLHELKESEARFSEANNYLERYKEHCVSLKNWLDTYQGQLDIVRTQDSIPIENLRIEVANLRQTLIEQQALNQEDKKNLLEARQQFEILLKDYQELLKSWDSYEQEQTSKGRQSEAYYEIQIRGLNEQIDNLTAKLVSNEENLSAKTEEINRIKNQGHLSSQEIEKIPILQAQVELYRSDFRCERERCEKLVSERNQTVKQNQELQQRVNQLESDIRSRRTVVEQSPGRQVMFTTSSSVRRPSSSYRLDGCEGKIPNNLGAVSRNQASSPSNDSQRKSRTKGFGPKHQESVSGSSANVELCSIRSRNTSGNERLASSPDENLYYCPKCNLGFTDFQPLENHVNECLDNDDPFL